MNQFGQALRLTLFGSSHGAAVGCVLDGFPSGRKVDERSIAAEMELRRPQRGIGTPRRESDAVRLISGICDGVSTGSPITLVIENQDVDSDKYRQFRTLPRPGHADLPALMKYAGHDLRGGGQFSGRMTAPLVAAGALIRPLLEEHGVRVGAFSRSIANVRDPADRDLAAALESRRFSTRAADKTLDGLMRTEIENASKDRDSVGGVVECLTEGLPIGVGEPWFDGLEGVLAHGIFAIPAVKGVEFGSGFEAANMKGSEHNDPFTYQDGHIITTRNSHGGILGGLSTGMPLLMRVAFKPTASIAQSQKTVDLENKVDSCVTVAGRHDPCIVPRAAAVVEAVSIMTLADLMIRGGFIAP